VTRTHAAGDVVEPSIAVQPPTVRTARVTGILYLLVGLSGMLGFLVIRPMLHDPDPATTLANLRENPGLARLGITLELGLVLAQALVALWFFRLFRRIDSFAATAIAVFGTVNAVAILGSAAALATALEAALGAAGGDGGTPQLMYALSSNLWGAGNLFFGLWLLPMGRCVLRSGSMPRPLGHVLVIGGLGYVLSGFLTYLVPQIPVITSVLVLPATVGEFWMIGYLLLRGIRRPPPRSPDQRRPVRTADDAVPEV
jgi:hypothetical protein